MAKRKPTGKSRLRAAGYIRMSSSKQESSPAQQRKEIIALAERKGYQIVAWYTDEAISGDEIEKRPDFRRLLEDARNGKFEVIVCWDQDRFGRFDSLRAGYVIEPLRMAGVRLVTVTQGEIDWNDFAGRMIYAIQQEGKNQFLVSLSHNVLRGRMQVAREGHGVSRAAYGYDRVFYDETGTLVHRVAGGERFSKPKQWKAKLDVAENQQEVDTVKFVFDRFANTDANMRSIAAELNRRGVKTRNGIPWKGVTVRLMLTNPVYIGWLVYGKQPQGRFSHVGDGAIGGDGPIVVEDAHPAIIDRVTFERVQRKLAERAKPNGRSRANVFLLTGLIFCGKTGLRFCGHTSSAGNRVEYYIRSVDQPGPDAPRECYMIRRAVLESFVIGKVTDILTRPGLEANIKQAVSKKLRSRRQAASNVKPLKTRLQALDRKIAKGAERLLTLDADDLADASKALSAWRTERRKLAADIDTITNGTPTSPSDELSRVMAELNRLRDDFTSADPDKLRAALKTTIDTITLFWGPGGRRKWKLQRGIIRFRESLYVAPTCPNRSTQTKPRRTARS